MALGSVIISLLSILFSRSGRKQPKMIGSIIPTDVAVGDLPLCVDVFNLILRQYFCVREGFPAETSPANWKVTNVWFYRKTSWPQHEFTVFEVEVPGEKKTLRYRCERLRKDEEAEKKAKEEGRSPSSLFAPMHDPSRHWLFLQTHNRLEDKKTIDFVTGEYSLPQKASRKLAQTRHGCVLLGTFAPAGMMTFLDLTVLLSVVSGKAETYKLLRHPSQRYWYAFACYATAYVLFAKPIRSVLEDLREVYMAGGCPGRELLDDEDDERITSARGPAVTASQSECDFDSALREGVEDVLTFAQKYMVTIATARAEVFKMNKL